MRCKCVFYLVEFFFVCYCVRGSFLWLFLFCYVIVLVIHVINFVVLCWYSELLNLKENLIAKHSKICNKTI